MQTIKVDKLNLSAGDWVLDVGCGEGRHLHAVYWNKLVNVVGVDINRQSLETAREGLQEFDSNHEPTGNWYLQEGNIHSLPFPDNHFDTVICSEVLEHIPNYTSALSEIDRVLSNSGKLAVSVPRYGPERICWWLSDDYHEVDGGHVRIFREKQLRDAVELFGFTSNESHYEHALHSPLWWLKCLLWWNKDQSNLITLYEKILEWDLEENPELLSWIESALNPIIGKSFVVYFVRDSR